VCKGLKGGEKEAGRTGAGAGAAFGASAGLAGAAAGAGAGAAAGAGALISSAKRRTRGAHNEISQGARETQALRLTQMRDSRGSSTWRRHQVAPDPGHTTQALAHTRRCMIGGVGDK
jgi:hypothetical protein